MTATSTYLITGGTRGLGRALAEQLLQHGYRVTICARSSRAVDETVAQLSPLGSILGIAGDLAEPLFGETLIAKTVDRFGQLDGVILNAAILGNPPLSSVLDMDADNLRRVLNVNVLAPLTVLQRAHPHLMASSNPLVLAFTSDAAHQAYPDWASYGSSKAALSLIVRTYSHENPSIATCLVDPGDMNTLMHHTALPNDPGPLRPPLQVASSLMPLFVNEKSLVSPGPFILQETREGTFILSQKEAIS